MPVWSNFNQNGQHHSAFWSHNEICVYYARDMVVVLTHLLQLLDHMSQKPVSELEEGFWWNNYLDKDISYSSSPLLHRIQNMTFSADLSLITFKISCRIETMERGGRGGRKKGRGTGRIGEREREKNWLFRVLELINHQIAFALWMPHPNPVLNVQTTRS